MSDSSTTPSVHATPLQEAIDRIAAEFDHPSKLELSYESSNGERTTTVTVPGESRVRVFEVRADGSDDDIEPSIRQIGTE